MKNLILLALLGAGLASAQMYTLTTDFESNIDYSNAYNTAVMDYAPGGSCGSMCTTNTHEYVGENVLTGSVDGSTNNCQWNDTGESAASYVYDGCETTLPLDGTPQDYAGTTTAYNKCSLLGYFFNAVITHPPIGYYYAAYLMTSCIGSTDMLGLWTGACSGPPNGAGCPGKCSETPTGTISWLEVIGAPLKQYTQCAVLLINGNCSYLPGACVIVGSAGYCGPPN
jgi:hypothetical protein